MSFLNFIYFIPLLFILVSLWKSGRLFLFLLIETLAFPFFAGWFYFQKIGLPSFFELRPNPRNFLIRFIASISGATIVIFTFVYLLVIYKVFSRTGDFSNLLNPNFAPIRYAFSILILLTVCLFINRYAKPNNTTNNKLINLRVFLKKNTND